MRVLIAVASILLGMLIGLVLGAALQSHAEEPPNDETVALADEAGIDADELDAAVQTVQAAGLDVDATSYLVSEGLLAAPAPAVLSCGWPICGPLEQRIWCDRACARNYIATHSRYPGRALCVAAMESSFDSRAWNPVPWGRWHEHAAGLFGWLQSTARSVGVVIGDIASEVMGFDRMLDLGRGREYAGIAWGRC